MAEWVLILWLSIDRGGGIAMQTMTSKVACEMALDAFLKKPALFYYEKHAGICVER